MIAFHFGEPILIWRLLILAVGTFNCGLGAYIWIEYLRGHITPRVYLKKAHVLAFIGSYLLLTAELCTEIGLRVANDQPIIPFRLTFASVAFPLGTYALVRLVETK